MSFFSSTFDEEADDGFDEEEFDLAEILEELADDVTEYDFPKPDVADVVADVYFTFDVFVLLISVAFEAIGATLEYWPSLGALLVDGDEVSLNSGTVSDELTVFPDV